jgi:hypothetical protein
MTSGGPRYTSSNPHVTTLTAEIHAPDLARALDDLLLLSGGPADLRCLLYVTKTLKRAFSGGAGWPRHRLFSKWRRLAELVNENASILEQKYPHLKPPPKVKHYKNGKTERLNPMYLYIDMHPLWAMLCATHEDPNLRTDYALLQMHILYARWREAFHKADEQERTITDILSAAEENRQMRVAIELGKAVRSLSTNGFSALLGAFEPSKSPPLFLDHLKNWSKSFGTDADSIFDEIFNHVAKERDARPGGQGSKRSKGPRKVRRESFPEYIEYSSDRIGIRIEHGDEDGFSSEATYHLVVPGAPADPDTDAETRNKEQHNFTSPLDAARRLGVHPAELGSQSGVHSKVPGAKSPGQARQVARARGRSTEVDRSLMPWSSDRLSLRELQKTILPSLESTLESSDATVLKSATLVAISIDSGRQMKDAVELTIEQEPKTAAFRYQRPDPDSGGCGIWTWDAIGPDYDSDFGVPRGMAMDRAPVLRYPASRLVTSLFERYCRVAKFRTVPFDRERDHAAEAIRWMKRQSGWENVTPAGLARLRWQALHEATAGELASACLILGRRAHQASVEMHYAILEVSEAREKFDKASETLWGEHAMKSSLLSPAEAAVVGARAFPKISLVQETVGRLRLASEEFFRIAPSKFDAQMHGKLLNGAVLYAVWHQFFCFATRAIRDAYQQRSLFADTNQVAILSDKDFDDHHKTRLIWADKRLLRHMKSIEERLASIRERLKSHRFPKDSPLFFLDDGKRALRITPKTVEVQLGAEFPFEVNAPRKLMRFLVRKAGLSHEDAEVYMGHWWDAREPWSPFSSFDWPGYLKRLEAIIPEILDGLGFTWIPGEVAQ